MPRKSLSKKDWSRLRRRWESGNYSFAALARESGLHPDTIARHARNGAWVKKSSSEQARTKSVQAMPEAKSPASVDPLSNAFALYSELSMALREGLQILANTPEEEDPSTARERAQLIRAHRRALSAVIDAARQGKQAGPKTAETGQPPSGLDLASARNEVLKRLERLDSAQAT